MCLLKQLQIDDYWQSSLLELDFCIPTKDEEEEAEEDEEDDCLWHKRKHFLYLQ